MNEYIEDTLTRVRRCPGRPSETKDPETGEYVRLKCESTITVTAPSKREANTAIKALMAEKEWSAITTLSEKHDLCKSCVAYAAKKVVAAKVAAAKKVEAAKVIAAGKTKQTTFLWGKHRVTRTILTPTDDS